MNSQNHTTKIFSCHFNERAYYRELMIATLSLGIGIPVAVWIIMRSFQPIALGATLYITILYIIAHMWTKRIFQRTNITITENNLLIYKVPGRKQVVYPIDKIEKIRQICSAQERRKCHAEYSLSLSRNGDSLIPEQGVAIWFNRKWHKRFCPIFFNPSDQDKLIECLISRNPNIAIDNMDNTEISLSNNVNPC